MTPTSGASKRLLDLKALSGRYSISVATLRKYCRGGMPHFNLGRKILVDPEEFYAWLSARFKVACSPPSAESLDRLLEEVLDELAPENR